MIQRMQRVGSVELKKTSETKARLPKKARETYNRVYEHCEQWMTHLERIETGT